MTYDVRFSDNDIQSPLNRCNKVANSEIPGICATGIVATGLKKNYSLSYGTGLCHVMMSTTELLKFLPPRPKSGYASIACGDYNPYFSVHNQNLNQNREFRLQYMQ
jgi:hypothetical protein